MVFTPQSVVIIGTGGAIGKAFLDYYTSQNSVTKIYALSRKPVEIDSPLVLTHSLDLEDEKSIESAASFVKKDGYADLILVTTGILHTDTIVPEKALKELSAEKFHKIFAINTIGPALIAKHFCPLLPRDKPSIFAALSARVGSISDNHLGGWYAYRASKSALNMILKTTSIEMARTHKNTVIVGLHPGTVHSHLSEPFSKNVSKEHLFTADYAVANLTKVLENLTPEDTGKVFAFDGEVIEY